MKTSFVKIIHPQGEKRIQEILQSSLHPLHPPKHAVCVSSLVLGSLCAPCRPSVSLLLLLDIFFFPSLGVTSVLIARKIFFSSSHTDLCSAAQSFLPDNYSVSLEMCCPEQSNPQNVLQKQPIGILLQLSPATAMVAALCEAARSQQQSWSWPPALWYYLYQLELPASVGWIMAYNEDIQL